MKPAKLGCVAPLKKRWLNQGGYAYADCPTLAAGVLGLPMQKQKHIPQAAQRPRLRLRCWGGWAAAVFVWPA